MFFFALGVLSWVWFFGVPSNLEVIFPVFCLCVCLPLFCLVCSLQPRDHLLEKGCHFGSLVRCVFLCFFTFPAGDYKAARNRLRQQSNDKHEI